MFDHISVVGAHSKEAILLVLDSTNRERFSDVHRELEILMNEQKLRDALLLVIANKQDLPNAMNTAEIAEKLGLYDLQQRTWSIQVSMTHPHFTYIPMSQHLYRLVVPRPEMVYTNPWSG